MTCLLFVAVVVGVVAIAIVVVLDTAVVVSVDGSCDYHNGKVRADEKPPWCQQVLPARAER